MKQNWIWIISSALFAVIGTWAIWLSSPSYAPIGAVGGVVIGLMVAAFAVAGEKRA